MAFIACIKKHINFKVNFNNNYTCDLVVDISSPPAHRDVTSIMRFCAELHNVMYPGSQNIENETAARENHTTSMYTMFALYGVQL